MDYRNYEWIAAEIIVNYFRCARRNDSANQVYCWQMCQVSTTARPQQSTFSTHCGLYSTKHHHFAAMNRANDTEQTTVWDLGTPVPTHAGGDIFISGAPNTDFRE